MLVEHFGNHHILDMAKEISPSSPKNPANHTQASFSRNFLFTANKQVSNIK